MLSSPIHGSPTEDILTGYEQWLLQDEVIDEKRNTVHKAIEVIQKEDLSLEHIKIQYVIDQIHAAGVPLGTII
jgi:hypothetical protein